MTYFWNLHWTSGISKVTGVTLMLEPEQDRSGSTRSGSSTTSSSKISQDPAMLVWLDNWLNKAAKPNENYARELMELFTLGIGNYTQTDVTERRARADRLDGPELHAGRQLQRRDVRRDNAAIHDNGIKTILGQTGQLERRRRDRHHPERTRTRGAPSRAVSSARSSGRSSRTTTRPTSSSTSSRPSTSPRAASIREVVRAIFLAARSSTSRTRGRPGSAAPSSTPSRRSGCSRARRDFSTPADSLSGMGQVLFNPSDAKGWDWGTVVDEHGHALRRATLANTLATNRGANGHALRPERSFSPGKDASTADKVVDILADRLNVVGRVVRGPRGLDRLHERERRRVSAVAWTNTAGQRRQEGPRSRAPDADEPRVPLRVDGGGPPWLSRDATSCFAAPVS